MRKKLTSTAVVKASRPNDSESILTISSSSNDSTTSNSSHDDHYGMPGRHRCRLARKITATRQKIGLVRLFFLSAWWIFVACSLTWTFVARCRQTTSILSHPSTTKQQQQPTSTTQHRISELSDEIHTTNAKHQDSTSQQGEEEERGRGQQYSRRGRDAASKILCIGPCPCQNVNAGKYDTTWQMRGLGYAFTQHDLVLVALLPDPNEEHERKSLLSAISVTSATSSRKFPSGDWVNSSSFDFGLTRGKQGPSLLYRREAC
jgi:hypothetical protein